MRSISAVQEAALASANRSDHVKVEVDSSGGGVWADLTAYDGRNWVASVSWDENNDNAIKTAAVELQREYFALSLSPMMTQAKANYLPWGSYLPFLAVGRGIRISVATVAADTAPEASDWISVFEGEIEDVDLGSSEPILKLQCLDTGTRLQGAFVENQSIYGSAGGTAVETVMQSILTAWAPSPAPTLYVPAAPGFALLPYIQQKEPVLDALRKLAQQFGWDVRYKWDGGTSAWRLTLYNPGRGAVTSLRTFTPNDYFEIRSPKISRQSVRNVIRVVWTDAATKTRQTTVVQDVNSIVKFGRRFMELVEAGSSQIDTSAEALALANAALNDLAEPGIEKVVEMPLFWPAEIGDLYTFTANGVHYDSDQQQAVVSLQHKFDSNGARTTMGLRGKVCGLFARWLQQEARPGVGSGADFQAPGTPGSTLQEPSIGTIVITYDDPLTLSPPVTDWANSECHVDGPYDAAPGGDFTPSAVTLKQIARSTRFEIAGLTPGKWYRIKIVVVDVKGNRATATTVQQQATEMVGPYHTNPSAEFGTINPNGDFGVMTKGASYPPDAWSPGVSPAAWGNSSSRWYFTNSDSQQGDKAVIWKRLTLPQGSSYTFDFNSDKFPIAPGQLYRIDWTWKWANSASGNNQTALGVLIELFTSTGVSLGVTNPLQFFEIYRGAYFAASGAFRSYVAENVWASDRTWYQVPAASTARFARVIARVNTGAAADAIYSDIYFDRLRIARSLASLEHKGGGTTRSCATNTWTKPWFTPAVIPPNIGIDNAFGFTPGVVSPASEHRYTVKQDGLYTIYGRCAWTTLTAGRSMAARLLLNGAVLATGSPTYLTGMTQYNTTVHWGPGLLRAGDYIQLEGLISDATARSFDVTLGATALYIRQTSLAEGR